MKNKKIVLVLMIIAVLSKVVGFFREIVLSYFWGATNISDAYLISTTIPTTIFTFIGAGITTGFIPIYTEVKDKKGNLFSNVFVNKLLLSSLVICIILIIIGEIFCGPIVKVFASGFNQDTFNVAVAFTRVSLFEIGFSTIMYIMTAYLQSENSFIPAACAAFPMNLMTIISIFLSSKGNYYYLCIGCLAASFAQAAFLIPFAIKKGFRVVKTTNIFSDANIKEMFMLALPTIIGTSVNDINVLVDRTLASQISIGGISALNYASKINAILQGIIVLSIVSYIYPQIAALAVKNEKKALNKLTNEAVTTINLIIIPASCIILMFSRECISLVYGRGAFDETAITMTSSILAFYSIGMIANGLREVYSRILFAYKDSKTPMINGALGMVINIILNIVLSGIIGIDGLALSTSISSFFILALLIYSLFKKKIWKPSKDFIISTSKIVLLTIVMCIVIRLFIILFSNYIYINNEYLRICISIFIGAIVYIFGAIILRIKEVTSILLLLKRNK